MAFGDFLTGATVGNAEQIDQKRTRRREDEGVARAHKQDMGKLVLQGLVNGTVRPEFGSMIMGEMGKLMAPPKPAGGLEGFLGASEQVETPSLDTMTSGGWSQAFMSPQELAARDTTQQIENNQRVETASMRHKMTMLPEFQKMLEAQGIPSEMSRAAAIKVLYGADAFGATGAPNDYWDPVHKRIFRGERDPIRGIVDVSTNIVVPTARSVKISAQDNWQTGEQTIIDSYTGEVLQKTTGVVPGARPFSPFFSPQLGGAYDIDPTTGQPRFRTATQPDGSPAPLPPSSSTQGVNPDFEKLKFHLQQVDKAADDELRARSQSNDPTLIEPAAVQTAMREAQDRFAKQWGYTDYQDLVTKLGGLNTRNPRVPSPPAGPGTARPGNTSPQGPDGWSSDKQGAQYKITPGGG